MVFKSLEVLFNFEGAALTNSRRKTEIFLLLISGDNSEEDTPVPIPNTEVKLFSADDTWREAAREIRTSPVRKKRHSKECLFCCDLECKKNHRLSRWSKKLQLQEKPPVIS